MKDTYRKVLMPAAASVLVISLPSCSQPAEENAAGTSATEPAATEEAGTSGGGSGASSQHAKGLLKAMSDYLAAQQTISMSYDSIFEVVSADHQKLQLATSGTVDLTRPDKIHTTRQSGFSDTEMFF